VLGPPAQISASSTDEALILEAKVPARCTYWSVILTNEIYETTDWYNHQGSLNGSQLRVDDDGIIRVVISAKDPGVPNWLDTAGYPDKAGQPYRRRPRSMGWITNNARADLEVFAFPSEH